MQTKASDKKIQKIDAEYYFDLNLKLLLLCNLKCNVIETSSKFTDKIFMFVLNILALIYVGIQIDYIRQAIISRNAVLAAQIFCQLVCNVQCLLKGFLLAIAIEKIQCVLQRIRLLWIRYPADDTIEQFVTKVADRVLTLSKCYVASNSSTIVAFNIPIIINLMIHYQRRGVDDETFDFSKILFLVKYPFELKTLKTYITAAVFEEFLLIIHNIFWVASDTLFAQMTTHVCLQFKVLKRDLINLYNRKGSIEKEMLLVVINRHRELLRLCALMEEIFSPIIFFTVFLSSLNVCVNVIAFREVLLQKSYIDISVYTCVLVIIIFQVFFFCIFAEKISEEAQSLADTVYNLNWTSEDYKLRFYMFFIVARAQKPFYFTGLTFFRIGHQRLTSIISTSFSYYMMLQTTSNK